MLSQPRRHTLRTITARGYNMKGRKKTMKTLKKPKLLFAMLLLLVSLTAIGISAGAEEMLSIQYGNVAYNDMTQLAFTIKGEAPTGSTVGIAVWNSDVSGELTKDNASYFSFTAKTLDEMTYYLTKGIPAPEMSTRLTVAPCLKDENGTVTIAGGLVEYSIYDYVRDRLDDDKLTDVQTKLYTKLVYYGNSAEKVLGDKTVNFPIFIASGGEAGKLGHEMAFADENGGATIRANVINEDGDYFLYWSAKDGSKIYDRVAYVTATEGNNVYTANYGDAADSAYAKAFNLYDKSLGRIESSPSTSGSPSVKNGHYYYWQEKFFFNSTLRSINTFEVASETDYTVLDYTNIEIKEENGTRYLAYDKTFAPDYMNVGAELQIFNKNSTTEDRVDFDIRIHETVTNEQGAFYVHLADGTTSSNVRVYMRYDAAGKLYFSHTNSFANGVARYAGIFERGEKISIAAEIEDGVLKLYVNGKLLCYDEAGTKLDDGIALPAAINASAAYVTAMRVECYSYAYLKYDLMNVSFVDTDKFN